MTTRDLLLTHSNVDFFLRSILFAFIKKKLRYLELSFKQTSQLRLIAGVLLIIKFCFYWDHLDL
jgi:hypothetical protein